jgi:hypothetical protein
MYMYDVHVPFDHIYAHTRTKSFNILSSSSFLTYTHKLYTAKMLMSNFEVMRKQATTCLTRVEEYVTSGRNLSHENPYRMVRLLRSVVANGNDKTAIFITTGTTVNKKVAINLCMYIYIFSERDIIII